MTSEPFFSTRIDATQENGNVFVVLGTARRLMREIGVDQEKIDEMLNRATSAGSYAGTLAVVREWFTVDTDESDSP